jgi:hypothetical protein
MSAKIISAYPGCGKSWYYNNYSIYSDKCLDKEKGSKILDSDSSLFSWIYDEEGNKTDTRNPDFPNNYIAHIKEHMDAEDIIFVSSHKAVRDALRENGINYYLIYPENDDYVKEEFMRRFRERGSDEAFIQFQQNHWNEFMEEMDLEEFPIKIQIDNNQFTYINDNLIAVINVLEIVELQDHLNKLKEEG